MLLLFTVQQAAHTGLRAWVAVVQARELVVVQGLRVSGEVGVMGHPSRL